MSQNFFLLGFLVLSIAGSLPGYAKIHPEKIYKTEAQKKNYYIRDGVASGGDQAISRATVQDIRRANQKTFERIVIELTGSREGEPVAIPRAPYFQVALIPEEKKITLSISGSLQRKFSEASVLKSFRKSRLIKTFELLPSIDKDRWTIAFHLKESVAMEVFELKNPTRIIIDIKERKI